MTRCDCCDLPVESCGKAAEQRQRAEAQAERAAARPPHGATATARYSGRCPSCDRRITVGAALAFDEEYGWVCADCARELDS